MQCEKSMVARKRSRALTRCPTTPSTASVSRIAKTVLKKKVHTYCSQAGPTRSNDENDRQLRHDARNKGRSRVIGVRSWDT